MKLQTKLIISVVILFGFIFIFGVFTINKEYEKTILKEEGNGKVKLIREARQGRKVTYKILELEDGNTFKIDNSLVETVNIGDSIYKIKGENFYNLIDSKTKKIRKIEM